MLSAGNGTTARVERTLLPAAFDFAVVLVFDVAFYWRWQ
jgi:hypothetical protein